MNGFISLVFVFATIGPDLLREFLNDLDCTMPNLRSKNKKSKDGSGAQWSKDNVLRLEEESVLDIEEENARDAVVSFEKDEMMMQKKKPSKISKKKAAKTKKRKNAKPLPSPMCSAVSSATASGVDTEYSSSEEKDTHLKLAEKQLEKLKKRRDKMLEIEKESKALKEELGQLEIRSKNIRQKQRRPVTTHDLRTTDDVVSRVDQPMDNNKLSLGEWWWRSK